MTIKHAIFITLWLSTLCAWFIMVEEVLYLNLEALQTTLLVAILAALVQVNRKLSGDDS